ncbi:DUF3578 domain-containing protein [Methanobacterium sp.]|uniref:MrcB family domain-containing protein n=1 Tax=Methanobacterium sp. TaxID=2164 RepID=UPI0031593CF9
MGLNDDQIKELLRWFVNSSETYKNWMQERIGCERFNHQWIQPELIKEMSNEDLRKHYLDYFNNGTGKKQKLIAIPRDRIIQSEKFRDSLLYLLNEEIDIKTRINELLYSNNEKHIDGMGKALITAFLMDFKPDKYCLWNGKTEMGLNALEWANLFYQRGDTSGDVYIKIMNLFKKLKDIDPELNLTYLGIDLFLHTISATEEGEKILEKIRNGPSELKIRYFIEKALKNHNSDKQEDIDEIRYLFEKGIPKYLENIANESIGGDTKRYKVEGVPGTRQTNSIDEFGYLPQIYVFDETEKQKDNFKDYNYYVLYILREDRKGIYLSLNHGQGYMKEILKEKGEWKGWFKDNELKDNIKERVQRAKDEIGPIDKFSDIMNLGSEYATSSSIFEAASIYSKYYTLENLPSEEELISDFKEMLRLHNLLITKNEGLTAIEDPNEIKKAKEIFENRFKEIVDETISSEFRNNKIWFPKLGIWTSFNETQNYFYNPFGVGKPTPYSLTTIEINFSFKGNKVSGVFAKDSSNTIYLLHRGKLGGKFVGKQILKENYGGEWVNVKEGDKESNLILIGALNEPNFLEKVKNFVFEVDRIKNNGGNNLNFLDYLNKKGFYFEPELIENFLLSIKVKPFVILTGNSGTGKTKIAQLFAQYLSEAYKSQIDPEFTNKDKLIEILSAKPEFADYVSEIKNSVGTYPSDFVRDKLPQLIDYNLLKELESADISKEMDIYGVVPVGANWTENRHVVGFYNVITKEFQRTKSLNLIINAGDHQSVPFFLILDEMNLSHVERYFSDFLSAMESKESIELHQNKEIEDDVPQKIKFSENLMVIGTVNVDETTYMFSPKVLDRANTIEFLTPSVTDYMNGGKISNKLNGDINYLENPLSNVEIRNASILELRKLFGNVTVSGGNFWDIMRDQLEKFQNILKKAGFDFGFRVINEIMRFMYVSWVYEGKPLNWANWNRYFDAQIKQKMLPRIHGSKRTLDHVADELLEHCKDYESSKKKLEEMQKILDKQRFVSFTN